MPAVVGSNVLPAAHCHPFESGELFVKSNISMLQVCNNLLGFIRDTHFVFTGCIHMQIKLDELIDMTGQDKTFYFEFWD